jgi:hypothetical protein
LTILTQWAITTHAFRRNRVSPEKKVVAAALCNGGFSYREVARILGGMSYIAARDSYLALVTSFPAESKRYRRLVEIDGSDVRIEGHPVHLWLARDVDSGEILSFHASPTGSAEDGSRFLASVGGQCTNRPYLRLGSGANFPRGLINLDLYFQFTPVPTIIGRLERLFRGGRISPET